MTAGLIRAIRLRVAGDLAEDVLTDVLATWIRHTEEKVKTVGPTAAAAYWDSVLMLLDAMTKTVGVRETIQHQALRELVLRMHVDLLERET